MTRELGGTPRNDTERRRMRSIVRTWILVAAAFAWLPASASAQAIQFGGAAEQVRFSMSLDAVEAKPGTTVKASIHTKIADGWHIYSLNPHGEETGPLPTEVTVDASDLRRVGRVQQPTPIRKRDNAFDMEVELFEREVTFVQMLLVPDTAESGPRQITATIRFMVCNDRSCLPPTAVQTSAMLEIVGGSAPADGERKVAALDPNAPQPLSEPVEGASAEPVPEPAAPTTAAEPATQESATTRLERARAQGLLAYLGFAVSVGFLALLTPCVFPMIPITVSFFTKKEFLTRLQGLFQAILYSLAIVGTFTVLGIALALAFGAAAIQGIASNIWVNAFVAGVFIVFALNLFGAFEIRVPYQLMGWLGSAGDKGPGSLATLLMGLTFTLTSFTCTVPFVGTVLVAATQGDVAWAALGMLGFSAAFASPFFLLALFPQLLHALPKSGGWLNAVKVTLGFVELAAGLKFLSNIDLVLGWRVLPREAFLAIWVALAIVAGVYLLGRLRLPSDTAADHVGVARMLWGVGALATGLFLLSGLQGKPLGELDAFLPPYALSAQASVAGAANAERHTWLQTYDEGMTVAKSSGKPIFIDFTGVTCTNCRWMEKNIFAREGVSELFDEFVLVQLWTDKADPESRANQAMQRSRFGTVALPFYAVMSPGDQILATFDGLTRDPDEFKSFLRRGIAQHDASQAPTTPRAADAQTSSP